MHRALVIALTLALGACAASPPPPPAPVSEPTPPPRPPTYAFFFAYSATLTLGAQRDGAPYEGPAQLLLVTSAPNNGAAPPSPEEPPAVDEDSEPVALEFRGGRAEIPVNRLRALASARALRMRVGTQEVDLPQPRDTNPFQCAQQIQAVVGTDACRLPLPPADMSPDTCDTPGRRAWQEQLAQQQERFEACYSDLSPKTLENLRQYPAIVPIACPRLVPLAGPEPDDALSVGMEPCLAYFRSPIIPRMRQAILRHKLPQAFAEAQRGNNLQMRQFYLDYRNIDHSRAEEIRQLALKKFGPSNPTTWLALRASLEAIRLSDRRFTLCDYDSGSAEVGYGEHVAPRFSQGPSAPDGIALAKVMIDREWQRRFQVSPQETRMVEQIVRARTGVQSVTLRRGCSGRGGHWYFAYDAKR